MTEKADSIKLRNAKTIQYLLGTLSGTDGLHNAEAHNIRKPLNVIGSGHGEQGIHRIVPGENESGEVGEELSAIVKEDKKEVDESESSNDVYFGDTCSNVSTRWCYAIGRCDRSVTGGGSRA